MTGSEFKFLRRVRIHDGECGAVARALHHAAQKVALVRNEQSLISDECIPLRQAGSEKASDSTFNERKQMSTKTSIKRIALVAVSALGFGLLSVVPAKAAPIASIVASSAISSNVIVVTGNTTNSPDAADLTATYLEVLASPDADLPVGLVTAATITNLVTITKSDSTAAGEFSATLNARAMSAGTYTFRVFLDKGANAQYTGAADEVAGVTTIVVAASDLVAAGSTTTTSLAVAAMAASGDRVAFDYSATNAFYKYLVAEKEIGFTISRTPAAADDGALRIEVVASPDATLPVGVVAAANDIATALSDVADSGADSGLAGYDLSFELLIDTVAGSSAANLVDTAGTYTFKVFEDADADNLHDATEASVTFSVYLITGEVASTDGSAPALPDHSANLSATLSSSIPATTADVTITALRGLTKGTSNGAIKAIVDVSPDADLTAGTVINANSATSARTWIVNTDGAGGRTFVLLGTTNGGVVNTAGSYTLRVWQDTDADNVVDASEESVSLTFTKGGTVGSSSLTTNKSLVVAGDTSDVVEIIATSVDADGNAVATAPTLTVSPTTAGSFSGSTQIGSSNQYRFTFTPAAASVAGTVTITSSVDAAVTTDDKTATLTFISVVNGTSLYYNTAAGISTGTSAKIATAGADTMSLDTAITTVYFTSTVATADAGKYIKVTTSAGASTSASAISRAGVTYVKTNSDGTITFPVTFTGPVAGDTYTMSIEAGATDYSYTVTYARPTPTMTLSPVANGGSVSAKYGDKLDMVATLTDQWLRPYASATITVTIPSTSRNPQTVNLTTNAAGKVTFSLTDTFGASATKTSDVITFTYSYLATATATAATNLQRSATVAYTATGPAVGSVAVTSATTADEPIDQVEEVPGSPAAGSRLVYTATVKDANGVALGAGVLVTFTGGADDLFLDGVTTGVTGANGTATVTVYRQKVGFASISASAGGKSGTSLPVKWVNAAADARNVAVAVEPTSIVSEGTATVKATVTDRWGNGVAGITVTFAETGAGRLNATTAVTNTAGVAQVDFTSAKNETGSNTITATISGGQSANLAGFVGTTAVAGVTAGNTSATAAVTVTKDTSTSTADALLELAKAIGTGNSANAAADAALEAIDAANAATDAANLAAEAADAATVAAEEARDAADAATAAVEALSAEVATLVAALKAQITTLANTVAKIAKRVRA